MHILSSFDSGVATLTLNSPQRYNALSDNTTKELDRQLRILAEDHTTSCVILTGSPPNFCSGADLKELNQYKSQEAIEKDDPFQNWKSVSEFKKPIIAAVTGYCLGGGLELAMMCDIIICSSNALFGQPEIQVGLMPGAGGTQRLTRLVGKARAMLLCLTGHFLSAQEALDWGLVAKVVNEEKLLDEAMNIAKSIAGHSAPAVRAIKASIQAAFEVPLNKGLDVERELFYSLFETEEQKSGVQAFLDKKGKR